MSIFISFIVLIIIIMVIIKRLPREPIQTQLQPQAKSKLPTATPAMSAKQLAATQYIHKSNDPFAKEQLRQIKDRPEAYNYYFNKYAYQNNTLKIALGLLTGYLTWELLFADSQTYLFSCRPFKYSNGILCSS